MNEWIYSYLAAAVNTWFYYMFHDNVFLDVRFALPRYGEWRGDTRSSLSTTDPTWTAVVSD